MEKRELEFEGMMKREELIDYLEKLIAGIRAGRIVVQHDAEKMELNPQEVVELEVEAKQKYDKEKLSVKISWKKSPAPSGKLRISSEIPPDAG